MNNIKLYVIILTICGTLASSIMFLIIKYLSSELNTYMIAFRAFLGLIILLPIIIKSKINVFKTKNLKIHLLRGTINSISMLLTFTGISLIALEKAAALTFAVPLYATVLSIIILKEVIRIHRTIGLLIGFGWNFNCFKTRFYRIRNRVTNNYYSNIYVRFCYNNC